MTSKSDESPALDADKTVPKETELSRIKLSNEHLRSNFTRVENSLRSLMENNAKEIIVEQNLNKLSNTQDLLAKNTSAILALPLDSISESTINNELKTCEKYDNSFTEISALISMYKNVPITDSSHIRILHDDDDEMSDDDG